MGNLEGNNPEKKEGEIPVERNLPVENDPGVEDEMVQDESERENTVETSEGNEGQEKDNVTEEVIEEESGME